MMTAITEYSSLAINDLISYHGWRSLLAEMCILNVPSASACYT